MVKVTPKQYIIKENTSIPFKFNFNCQVFTTQFNHKAKDQIRVTFKWSATYEIKQFSLFLLTRQTLK